MKKIVISLILLLTCLALIAEEKLVLERDGGKLHGTLLMPEGVEKPPVVLIIAGSGPTDRNGNNPQIKMDTYKLLAEGLRENGIASFRFDKRMVGESRFTRLQKGDPILDDYINDVKALVEMLHNDNRFSGVILAGHSEGALIALAAAQDNPHAAKIITLTCSGRRIDILMKEQFAALSMSANTLEEINGIIASLKKGEIVENMSVGLKPLFSPSSQSFLISLYIPNMSHPLKKHETTDRAEQLSTVYTNPALPLHEALIPAMAAFIKK